MKFFQAILTCFIFLLLAAGCATVEKFSFDTFSFVKSDVFEHTVKWPQENLYNITIWRTGNLDNYNAIRKINSDISPYSLSVGDKILIPNKLVTNKEPMPEFTKKVRRSIKEKLPTQPVGRTYYTHRVTIPGESLSIIAKWYTGDLKKWEQLAAANPNLNPNRIDIGDEILIPEDMMIRRDPITKTFVESFLPKKKISPPSPEPEAEVVQEPPPEPAPEPQNEPAEEDNLIELVPPKF